MEATNNILIELYAAIAQAEVEVEKIKESN